jgi:hypothetical protein
MSDFETTGPSYEHPQFRADSPTAVPPPTSPRRRWLLSKKAAGWIAAAVLACGVTGMSVDLATSTGGAAVPTASAHRAAGAGSNAPGNSSNARSGPAAGGASGTVSGIGQARFTLTTSTGQKVTVDDEEADRIGQVTNGESVLVLGTVSNTTIQASEIMADYTTQAPPSSAAQVIPFQRGTSTTSKQVGQIPANWSQGSGTIVSGTAANQATEAALAAYPGGIVDRVVQLSNGEYNVHYIGVNWPHHVFVSSSFQVVGAL